MEHLWPWVWTLGWTFIVATIVLILMGGVTVWTQKRKNCRSGASCIKRLSSDTPNQNWKGIVFIVCNTYANGKQKSLKETIKDAREIDKFFEEVNYKVVTGKDLTYEQFMDTCEYLAAYLNYPPSCTRIIVYFSGHGGNGNIIMQDGETIRIKDVQELLRMFPPKENGKQAAKILLIDACRVPLTGLAKLHNLWCRFWSHLWCLITCCDEQIKCADDSNELVVYATTEGHAAYNLEYGGFWTQKLIEQLYQRKDEHILEVLTAVNNEMEKEEVPGVWRYQRPQSIHGLTEKIYFWKEDEEMNNGTEEDNSREEDTNDYRTDTASSLDDDNDAGTQGGHIIQRFDDLYTELESVTDKYKQLGQQLRVPDKAMKFESNSKSLEDQASDMLSRWLEQDPQPSWKKLINVIKITGKAPNLVKELQEKYKDKMDNAPEIFEINNDVAPKVATFYNELGMKLIDEDEWQNMDHQFGGAGDTKARFRSVLNTWWTSTSEQRRTWESIVEALESKGMKLYRLAHNIKTKHIQL